MGGIGGKVADRLRRRLRRARDRRDRRRHLGARRRRQGALAGQLQAGRPGRQLGRSTPPTARKLGVIDSQRSARPGRDQADPAQPAAGDGGDRGPALLRTRRHRHRGHPARRASRTSKPAKRSRAARRSPSSWSATSASSNPKRNIERKIIEAKLAEEYADHHSPQRNPRPVPQHRLLRDGRRAAPRSGSGRPRRSTSPSRSGSSTCRRRRCSPASPRRPPNTTRSSTRRRRKARRNEVLRKMAKLGCIGPRRARGGDRERARAEPLRRDTSTTASPTSSTTSRTS